MVLPNRQNKRVAKSIVSHKRVHVNTKPYIFIANHTNRTYPDAILVPVVIPFNKATIRQAAPPPRNMQAPLPYCRKESQSLWYQETRELLNDSAIAHKKNIKRFINMFIRY